MGISLTIVYIVLTIISPDQFGSAWTGSHLLVYLAVLTALFSLPSVLSRSSLLSSVQTYLLLAFIATVGLSQIANHWLGGALQAWLVFLPSSAVYFFIVANVTTVRRLKIVTLATAATCLGLVVEAFCCYYTGFLGDTFVLKMHADAGGQIIEQLPRLRGVGFLADPNDFSQILIIALALFFVAWRQGRLVSNVVFVLAPSAVLLWAVYLTHSRGALIGLTVFVLLTGYERIGKVPAFVLSGLFGLGLMALDFTGGRAIDASAGSDRLSLWATGLELFKSSPIFGVGFGNFTNFSDHTAHNSFILPLAELGIIGATIWVAMLVTTVMDLNRLIALRERKATAGAAPSESAEISAAEVAASALGFSLVPAQASGFNAAGYPIACSFDARPRRPAANFELACLEDEAYSQEVVPCSDDSSLETLQPESFDAPPEALPGSPQLPHASAPLADSAAAAAGKFVDESSAPDNSLVTMRLALVTFMVTGWFLSRTYETTIYIVLGLAVAVIGLEPAAAEPHSHRGWISWTLAVVVFLVVFVYLVVRLRH